ncbi:hypothetical protein MBRA_05063 [Methylobacterium brachiatum]|jgi:hypothetical protein|nr:hypothetical protein MBRA_05063 [Methylobacterium brachiatum]
MTAPSKIARVGLLPLVSETPLTPQPPALVLLGQERGRHRAAWFDASDAEAATTAAAAMGLRVLPLINQAGRDLAGRLARGRVLPSGRALVPFTKRELYTRLVALAGEGAELTVTAGGQSDPPSDGPAVMDPPTERQDPTAAGSGMPESRGDERPSGVVDAARNVAGAPADALPAPRPGAHLFVGQPRPGDRNEIGLGSIVLAHEGPDEGWWEAEVIGTNGRTFSLRWRDYPTHPTILRKADELALLPPGEA